MIDGLTDEPDLNLFGFEIFHAGGRNVTSVGGRGLAVSKTNGGEVLIVLAGAETRVEARLPADLAGRLAESIFQRVDRAPTVVTLTVDALRARREAVRVTRWHPHFAAEGSHRRAVLHGGVDASGGGIVTIVTTVHPTTDAAYDYLRANYAAEFEGDNDALIEELTERQGVVLYVDEHTLEVPNGA